MQAAQFDCVDERLAWSGASAPKRILDVGCGFGGTSRHLAKKFPDAAVEGERLLRTRCGRVSSLLLVSDATKSC